MRATATGLALVLGLACAAAWAAPATPTVLHISSHLPKAAKVSLDGKPAISAPGYGSTNVPATAGRHVLRVTTPAGAAYAKTLDLQPQNLMTWKGRGYWCVNLLDHDLEVYSTENCEEEVTDAG